MVNTQIDTFCGQLSLGDIFLLWRRKLVQKRDGKEFHFYGNAIDTTLSKNKFFKRTPAMTIMDWLLTGFMLF